MRSWCCSSWVVHQLSVLMRVSHLHTLSACKSQHSHICEIMNEKPTKLNQSLCFQLQILHPSSQADQNPVIHQSKPRPHRPRTPTSGEQRCPGGKIKERTGADARDPHWPSKLRLFLPQKSTSAASSLLKRPPDPERKGSSRLPKPKIWGGLEQTLNYGGR